MKSEETIGVLGGGISGITFASIVKNSEVLEKNNKMGGLASSIYESGYTFDLGSHIIFSNNKKVLDFMLDALGENKIKHLRNTKIAYKGRYVKYPFENGLSDLTKREALACAYDYILAKNKKEKPKNFKEWMYLRFGKSIAEKYLYPYNSKIWDYPPEEMDTFWVEGRVPQPSTTDVLKAALGIETEGYTHQLNFFYPSYGGYEALVEAIAKRIEKHRLVNNFEIARIKKEGEKWQVYDKNKDKKPREYNKIVSTIHIRDFIDCLSNVDTEVKEAVDNLKWNSIYLVMLGIKKTKINNMHWVYIPDPNNLPNRLSFPSNYSPNVAPNGYSSILVEITFNPNGKKSKLKHSEIIETTIENLQSMQIINKEEVVFSKVITYPYAYVVYDREYQSNISKVYDFAKREGITLLGRFSEFRYINADKCIESAIEKAQSFI